MLMQMIDCLIEQDPSLSARRTIWKCVGCVGFLTEGIPNVFLVC